MESIDPGSSQEEQGDHNEQGETLKFSAIKASRTKEALEPYLSTATNDALQQELSTTRQQVGMTRGRTFLLLSLLCILLFHALSTGATLFTSPQGWASVLGEPSNTATRNLFALDKAKITKATPGATPKVVITPAQYINLIINRMSLDQKLGQMMMVQFTGPDLSPSLSTMIDQYNIGAVIFFYSNNNIINKDQLKSLTQQMQRSSTQLPLAIATDQEGGTVDRLSQLDGPRPSAASIGATNDPAKAMAAGIQDAQDLSSYGINLNLAPVVDVDALNTSEVHQDFRTFGSDASTVAKMAGAYLQGLQQSGKVIGTLKHFPGLGDVSIDPHYGIPRLNRSKDEMEQIDWAPYRILIQQHLVHAIMVTHVLVPAIDSTKPSSLSPRLVQDILRDEMGYQGVIMTDSLTMAGITDFYTPGQAAALAIEAGSDLIMGAASPNDVATMIDGIKQAMSSGEISQQRIDVSVQRILMMKYEMGLLPIPKN